MNSSARHRYSLLAATYGGRNEIMYSYNVLLPFLILSTQELSKMSQQCYRMVRKKRHNSLKVKSLHV